PLTADAGPGAETTTAAATATTRTARPRTALVILSRLSGFEEGRDRRAPFEDVLHAPPDRRRHLRVGEDVEALLTDGVEHIRRHVAGCHAGHEQAGQKLAAHLGHGARR